MKDLKSGTASQREVGEMRLFSRLASFSVGYVVPPIVAERRLASLKKRSHRASPDFSNTP